MSITGSRSICYHAEAPVREYRVVVDGHTSILKELTERIMSSLGTGNVTVYKVTRWPDGLVTEIKLSN